MVIPAVQQKKNKFENAQAQKEDDVKTQDELLEVQHFSGEPRTSLPYAQTGPKAASSLRHPFPKKRKEPRPSFSNSLPSGKKKRKKKDALFRRKEKSEI